MRLLSLELLCHALRTVLLSVASQQQRRGTGVGRRRTRSARTIPSVAQTPENVRSPFTRCLAQPDAIGLDVI